MKELNPEWVRSVLEAANGCPYFQLQSMNILELAPGRSKIRIDVQTKHLQPFGQVHGGVFSSLIDAAGWWAAYTVIEEGLGLTTLEMKLNYLAPVQNGKLIGLGRSIKVGRNIGLAEAGLENEDGRLVAHGTVTVMIVPALKMEGQSTGPSKFI
ncbi:MAG: PaaI family thioesterase [Thermodesulfobacteriota bacterium]